MKNFGFWKTAAALTICAVFTAVSPAVSMAGVVGRGAGTVQPRNSGANENGAGQTDPGGTEPGGSESGGTGSPEGQALQGGTESGNGTPAGFSMVHPDPDAPAATRQYGYTYEDALGVAEQLYSYETNPVKKEICMSFLLNSIWYEPDHLMMSREGNPLLCIYRGSMDRYERSYLLALDGLEFFSNPTVLFLRNAGGELLLCVSTGHRFTEAEAFENYQTIRGFLGDIAAVKAATEGRDDADRAKFICDYVADRLSYDTAYQKNSLADALRSGVTACVGYNNMTELLFRHCGLPYVSVVGSELNGSMEHIFGMAKIGSAWLVFDTTNYDRDNGKEPFWIFSDRYREGLYYGNFKLVEDIPEN